MNEERLLDRLADAPNEAEYHLDLAGLDLPHARETIAQMLERNRFRPPRTILVTIEAPPEGGGETLFQPVGHQLLDARRAGLLSSMHPLTAQDGPGYWIKTTGKTDTDPAADDMIP